MVALIHRVAALVVFVVAASSAHAFQSPAKLNYKQVQDLKDARFYLDQAEPEVDDLSAKAAELKPRIGDPSVPLPQVLGYRQRLGNVVQKIQNANNRFKNLPLDHPEVREQAQRVAPMRDKLVAAERVFMDAERALRQALDGSNFPDLDKDLSRMKELSQQFNVAHWINDSPELAIPLIRQFPPAVEEYKRLVAKYGAVIAQQGPAGQQMSAAIKRWERVAGDLESAMKQFVQEAPQSVGGHFDQAIKLAEQAVAEKKPAFFAGGVADQMRYAQVKMEVLEAITAGQGDVYASLKKRFEETAAKIASIEASLAEDIIRGNRLPPDRYAGADREQLVALVRARWLESNPKDEILAVRLIGTEWKRETRWEWSSGNRAWEKVDRSRLQANVIVRMDESKALLGVVNLVKNHMEADVVTAPPWDKPDKPSPQFILLLEQVKWPVADAWAPGAF